MLKSKVAAQDGEFAYNAASHICNQTLDSGSNLSNFLSLGELTPSVEREAELKIQIMNLSAAHIKKRNIIIYLKAAAGDYIIFGAAECGASFACEKAIYKGAHNGGVIPRALGSDST